MIRRALLAALLAGTTLAAPGLVVKPAGDESFDPATGVRTLPNGGTITDSATGLTIQAGWIELKAGEFVRARAATLSAGDAATIRAANVDYQVKADRLTATGDLTLSTGEARGVTAERVVAFPEAGQAVALGKVRGTKPVLAADAIAVDARARELFLYGNLRFEQGTLKFSAARSDAFYLVTVRPDGKLATTNRPDAAKLRAYLDRIERARR